jgi:hypothetical protein
VEHLSSIRNYLTDGRFDTNLVALYGIIVFTILISLIIRRMLAQGGIHVARWTGLPRATSPG